MYTEINKCRICKKSGLVNVLSLGNQYLTGVFPKSILEKVTKGTKFIDGVEVAQNVA